MPNITDIEGNALFPLSQLVSADSIPLDIIGFDRAVSEMFEQVNYTDVTLQPVENGYLGRITLVLDQEVALAPFGDVLELVVGSNSGLSLFEVEISLETRPGGYFFRVGLVDVPVILRIRSEILYPLKPGTLEPDLTAASLDITLGTASIWVGTEQTIELEYTGSVALPQCMIGESGLVISAESIRWLTPASPDLPANTPEAFIGLYLENATTVLAGLTLDEIPTLNVDYLFLGHGGITCSIDLANLDFTGSLLGFGFTLETLGAELVQNAITASKLGGRLIVPFFDNELTLSAGIRSDGGIHATLEQADDDGLFELPIPGLGTLTLSSIGFVDDEQGTAVLLSGTLQLTVLSPALQWPAIELQELRIDSGGNVQLPNGWIDLQEPTGFNLYGFNLEITRIGFGNTDDDRRWVGFSGGVQLLPMLPTGASVEGLRIIWDPANPNEPPEITLQGVGVELTLPGVLRFDGDVAFITEEEQRYFQGNANLDIIPIGLNIDASLKIGTNTDPEYKFLYTYMDFNPPIGIPLFATGAAIYGISGLYGMNVAPSAENSDWYGWYAAAVVKCY